MNPVPEVSAAAPRPREWAPWFAPLLLAGCSFGGWWRILRRNCFRVNWRYWPALALATLLTGTQSLLRGIQWLAFGRRLGAVHLTEPPIFIIGHWRTGTTWLHYLLAQDEQHVAPNSYECFAPNHFALTERWFMKLFGGTVPFRRPMDNMLTSLGSPQEDEFALMLRGQPSLYWSMVFPNRPLQDADYLDLEQVAPQCRERWKRVLQEFLNEMTYLHGKRVVLKNPLHGARLGLLLEMFPGARFVNLVRNPQVVFPSTLHMHKTSSLLYSWQRPCFAGLEERVLEFGRRLHAKVEAGRQLIPEGQFHELRYEDLISDPVGELRKLYAALRLDGFAAAEPRFREFVERHRGYQTNTYEVGERERQQVARHWREIAQRHGYSSTNRPVENGDRLAGTSSRSTRFSSLPGRSGPG